MTVRVGPATAAWAAAVAVVVAVGSWVLDVQCSSGVRLPSGACGEIIQFASCVSSPSAQLTAVAWVSVLSLLSPANGQAGNVSGSSGCIKRTPVLSEKQLPLPSPS